MSDFGSDTSPSVAYRRPNWVVSGTACLLVAGCVLTALCLSRRPLPYATLAVRDAERTTFSDDGTTLLVTSRPKHPDGRVTVGELVYEVWKLPEFRRRCVIRPGGLVAYSTFEPWQMFDAWLSPDGSRLLTLSSNFSNSLSFELSSFDTASGEKVASSRVGDVPSEWRVAEQGFKAQPTAMKVVAEEIAVVSLAFVEPANGSQFAKELLGFYSAEQRFELPELTPAGAEIHTRLQPSRRRDPRYLIVWQLGDDSEGWRLLETQTLRTESWVAEPTGNLRTAMLSADDSVLITGDVALSSHDAAATPGQASGIRMLDAAVGGDPLSTSQAGDSPAEARANLAV